MIRDESNYSILDWWKKVIFSNYANFSGRARRAEFWYFTLLHYLIIVGLAILSAFLNAITNNSEIGLIPIWVAVLYFLATVIPNLAVAVRRLHDTGKSGLWLLAPMIPFVGSIASIVLLVFYCLEGDSFANDYGLDPKNPQGSLNYSGPYSIFDNPDNQNDHRNY